MELILRLRDWSRRYGKRLVAFIAAFFIASLFVYATVKPPKEGDWQPQLAVQSTAEFNGDSVLIKNVRNFRYSPTENDMHPAYYDKTYDLNAIKGVWYITEPFNENKLAAHTFLSFEFENGDFLSLSIEARKTKSQSYSVLKGMLRTYPLIYVAADERDVVMLRANLRKDNVYVYPVKLSSPENKKLLLLDMLKEMNDLQNNPDWYNTVWDNCTSRIAKHVNNISSGRVSLLSWRLWLTASADELALKEGLLDTNLDIEEARKKYFITEKSIEIGDSSEYSKLIRNFE